MLSLLQTVVVVVIVDIVVSDIVGVVVCWEKIFGFQELLPSLLRPPLLPSLSLLSPSLPLSGGDVVRPTNDNISNINIHRR